MTSNKPLHALFAGILFLVAILCARQAAAQAWTQLEPTGGPPAARVEHSAVFNITGDRMVMFGGDSTGLFNDTWVLSYADGTGGTPTWIQLSPTSTPNARTQHTAVYAAATNSMIVFGGFDDITGFSNSTLVLSHADGTGGTPAWTQLFPSTPPPARVLHTAVYNPSSNSMVVFGGYNNATNFNDIWVLSHADGTGGTPAWTQLSPTGTSPSLYGHSAAYAPASNSMIVFGGYSSNNGDVVNDTWVLSHADGTGGAPAWIQLNPTGTPPIARDRHTAVYDPATNRMIVFDGFTRTILISDTWVLSHADGTGGTPSWVKLSPTGALPSARLASTAVYDPATNRMIMFGGVDDNADLNDTWVLSNASGAIDLAVGIDIRPNTDANNISLKTGGDLPVAILSSASFDAPSIVDTSSLTFGHSGTENSLTSCNAKAQDVNGDKLKDLVCHFDISKTGFQIGDTLGYLKGATTVSNTLHGSDMVKVGK